MPKRSVQRWKRVFKLRRAIVPHILMAGMRPPMKGEKGPQKFVSLTDELDDVLFEALEKESQLEQRRCRGRHNG